MGMSKLVSLFTPTVFAASRTERIIEYVRSFSTTAHSRFWPLTTDIAVQANVRCWVYHGRRAMHCILMGAYAISGKNKPGQRKWPSLPHETWQQSPGLQHIKRMSSTVATNAVSLIRTGMPTINAN
jgi:hypothetical protein